MKPLQIAAVAALVFFCLWTALLARLKGYSATCWLLAGGIVGVVALCLLPQVAANLGGSKKRKGDLLGLILTVVTVLAAGLLFLVHFLVTALRSENHAGASNARLSHVFKSSRACQKSCSSGHSIFKVS